MKRICAWCGKILEIDKTCSDDSILSHGICSLCRLEITNYKPRKTKDILDSLLEPVFLVDSTGTIITANKSAAKLLNKEDSDIENRLGGDVFECSYASEGGCGNTVHCMTCAVRNTVMDTLKNGKNYEKVPAFQSIKTDNGAITMKFLISTEISGSNVLLRIDDVSVQ